MLDNIKTCRIQIKRNNFKIAKETINKTMSRSKIIHKNKMKKLKMKVENKNLVKISREETTNNKMMIIQTQKKIKIKM